MSILSVFRSNWVVVSLIILSLLCLYPGLTQPIMSLRASAVIPLLGEIELYHQTQSIWSGIQSLNDSGYWFVAFLIFLFSIFVPVLKLVLLVIVLVAKHLKARQFLHSTVLTIGKWSMADVFVVAIFIAFLAGQANPNMQASLHDGFYWFLSYCVISVLATQLMKLDFAEQPNQ